MDYALNVKMDYPIKTDYSDYEGSDYSGYEDTKKRKVTEGGNGNSSVKLSRDELKTLLEPLSKEQLVLLLVDAYASPSHSIVASFCNFNNGLSSL